MLSGYAKAVVQELAEVIDPTSVMWISASRRRSSTLTSSILQDPRRGEHGGQSITAVHSFDQELEPSNAHVALSYPAVTPPAFCLHRQGQSK